jgi:oligopeptide/dipeptide ABC transporter ATP-binding protein
LEAPLLSVRDLSTGFRVDNHPVPVTDKLGFDVCVGETVCIIGESGCGKTTTLLSVMGLSGGVVSGSVRLCGQELTLMRERDFRKLRGKKMSYIFQEPRSALNPVQTVGNSFVQILRAHRHLPTAEARQRAVELLSRVNLPNPGQILKSYPHELSGGMRQRVLIAAALANDPALILADEPTSSLDVTIREQIIRLFCEIKSNRSCSFLIATHDLKLVRRMAERILVMYAGQIVEQGVTGTVLSAPVHPYTRALISSAAEDPLSLPPPLYGEPPSPFRYPGGCRFHTRCPDARESCASCAPPEKYSAAGSLVRCHIES